MGRILLVGRLAVRDLRRRRIEAALLLLAIMAATTTLTLGLVLHDAASDPYQSTREATNGPDVVASVTPYPSELPDDPAELVIDQPAELSGLEELASAPGVIDHSGPYPVIPAELQASGRTSDVQAVGRDAAPASVDQPELIQGSWVSDGGVVVEAAFADALDVRVGDPVTLDGRSFEVVGVAVTAAMPPYPEASCFVPVGCVSGVPPDELADAELPPGLVHEPRPGLAHRGGRAEPRPGSGLPVLRDEPEAGGPGRAPRRSSTRTSRRARRRHACSPGRRSSKRPPSWPETPRSFC